MTICIKSLLPSSQSAEIVACAIMEDLASRGFKMLGTQLWTALPIKRTML